LALLQKKNINKVKKNLYHLSSTFFEFSSSLLLDCNRKGKYIGHRCRARGLA